MKIFHSLLLLALVLSLNGCSSVTVNQDYNPDYNFQNLKTYSWLDKDRTVGHDTRINNDLVKARMIQAIEANLNAKGYTKVDKNEASFLIMWHGSIDSKMQVDTINRHYGPYGYGSRGAYNRGYDPFMRGSSTHTVVSEYDLGTLLIDILDPSQHKLIWRGTGQGVVQPDRTPTEITEGINDAVQAILEPFPPTLTK